MKWIANQKDAAKASGIMAALPVSKKAACKAIKIMIAGIKLEETESLAIVDTGSFVHALNAEKDLPNHKIEWHSEEEANKYLAETACGGILKRLGTVHTQGLIGDTAVDIVWNHMKVKCPILSVVRLCEEGNGLWIHDEGGDIVNLKTGKRMKFHKLNGIYYVKI